MRPPIQGGTVLLTGASAGIGEAFARELGPLAKTLILVARRKERMDALKQELEAKYSALKVMVCPCDLTDLDATAKLLDQLEAEVGTIDVLINNAGFGDVGVLEFSSWDKLQRMIQLNVTTLTYLTHRLVGPMRKQGKGGILNISSGFGLTFMPGFGAYVGTKHYVTSFTESIRIELAGAGVVVSQVCPGPVDTEFESVAGNPVGQSPPALVTISASQCARTAMRGFLRGKALIIPGFVMKLVIAMGRLTPRFLLRFFYAPAARFLYRKQEQQSIAKDAS